MIYLDMYTKLDLVSRLIERERKEIVFSMENMSFFILTLVFFFFCFFGFLYHSVQKKTFFCLLSETNLGRAEIKEWARFFTDVVNLVKIKVSCSSQYIFEAKNWVCLANIF